MENHSIRETTLLLEERPAKPSWVTLRGVDLTPREAEILFWISMGKTNPEIASICEISIRTVQKHVEHTYEKLGVETRTAAMLRAIEPNNDVST